MNHVSPEYKACDDDGPWPKSIIQLVSVYLAVPELELMGHLTQPPEASLCSRCIVYPLIQLQNSTVYILGLFTIELLMKLPTPPNATRLGCIEDSCAFCPELLKNILYSLLIIHKFLWYSVIRIFILPWH